MDAILIIGHRQPDTDCIASVIGYAEFKNHTEPGKYVAARCGQLNAETCYALEKFKVAPPVFVDTVAPRVSDLVIHRISVTQDVPVADIAGLMDAHDIRNVPITDDKGVLVGVVGEHGLARLYVRQTKAGECISAPIPLETFTRILSARTLAKTADTIEGRVFVTIDAPEIIQAKGKYGDIAVVGDNEPAQLALISGSIKVLIIAGGAPVSDRVIGMAQQKGVCILATDLDAFGIGTMINHSLPARLVMETDIPRLSLFDTIENAKRIVFGSKFRSACVVESNGTLQGIVTRTTLLAGVHRKVILLDHNEAAQAVDGIDDAEILEIIDHHRLRTISTLKPVKFLNNPVGSTSTIITGKFRDAGVAPSHAVAGMLLSGILSDTLVLKTSTTTEDDREAVAYLSHIAGIEPSEFGMTLLEKGMNLTGATTEDLLTRDTKRYELFGDQVIIAQVMIPSFEFTHARVDEIRKDLARLRVQQGVDAYLGMFTSAGENASELFVAAEHPLLKKLELDHQPVRLPGMMSRKKDLLPWFGERFRRE